MVTLNIGDQVTWSSHAKGYRTVKTGKIVYRRPAQSRTAPWAIAQKKFPFHKHMFDGNKFHENGVFVEVPTPPGSRAKPKLYMPWPSSLSKVE